MKNNLRQLVTALSTIAMLIFVLVPTPVHAAGCKVVTNPADSGSSLIRPNPHGGTAYNLEISMPFTTGDASSDCGDVNVRYFKQDYLDSPSAGACLVQYLSGGTWHDDSAGVVYVPYNSSALTVLGSGYANGATVRIDCLIDFRTYPTYQALV